MKEPEMKVIADFIRKVADNVKNEEVLAGIKAEVRKLTAQFPLYPELD
jgi:glycine/serine hydroxymethyltransferase